MGVASPPPQAQWGPALLNGSGNPVRSGPATFASPDGAGPNSRRASLTIASSRSTSAVMAGVGAPEVADRSGAPGRSEGFGLIAAGSSCRGRSGTLALAGEGGFVVGRGTASGNAGVAGFTWSGGFGLAGAGGGCRYTICTERVS